MPKFSKFIHGVATLLDHRVSLLPFWLPQMDKDIRKLPAADFTPSVSKDNVFSCALSTSHDQSHHDIEVVVEQPEEGEAEGDERTPLLAGQPNGGPTQTQTSAGFLSSFYSRITSPFSTKTGASQAPITQRTQKRIVLPVRIEPKVFFANERTFLSWLHFCIVLGGLALGLLNFGDKVGQISGVIFTVVAMMFIIYALFVYQWRAHQIRNRRKEYYTCIL